MFCLKRARFARGYRPKALSDNKVTKADGGLHPNHYPPTMGELARLILQSQSSGEPITLSINGQGNLPVADHESIQQLHELVDQLESIEVLKASVRSFEEEGKTYGLEDVC